MKQSKPFTFNKVLMWVYSILMSLPVILVFIFYNYYGLDFLVYVGWMIFSIGLVLIFLAGHEFQKNGGVPKGKHLVHTTVLVDSGIYALVLRGIAFGNVVYDGNVKQNTHFGRRILT